MKEQKRNPPWDYDEIILALDFYFHCRPSIPEKGSKAIKELSDTLRALAARLGNEVTADYRNPNGVYMKLMNFKALDPQYEGAGLTSASAKDKEVFETYAADTEELSEAATVIREVISSTEPIPIIDEPEDQEHSVIEGKLLTRTHRSRERNASIIKKKKDSVLKAKGKLACEACGFDFSEVYGEHGEGFIECHHTVPVSQLHPGQSTKLSELVLLCSNCHRMVHRGKKWLSVRELRSLLNRSVLLGLG